MPWLPVKHSFFYIYMVVLEPRAMSNTGKMSKEKKERKRRKTERAKKGTAPSPSF
jgi:hypothetical protein